MIGGLAAIAAVLLCVAVTIHHHNAKKNKKSHVLELVVSVLFTVASFLAVVAATLDIGTVLQYTGGGAGLTGLVIVDLCGCWAYWHQMRHRGHFHAHGTPAIGAILGAGIALAVVNFRQVFKGTASAFTGGVSGASAAISKVNSGQVTTGTPAPVTSGERGVFLAIGFIIGLLILVKVVRSHGGKKAGGRSMRELEG
jgi:4-amino-4-deoxy-L-arabinose transferase-like glycosyltransferase